MNNYKQVYKNTGTVPRTMGEAYRNAEYATPIHRFNSEMDDAKRFFADLTVSVFLMALLACIGYAIYQIILV